MKKLLFLFLCLGIFVSCSQDDDSLMNMGKTDSETEVQAPSTRAVYDYTRKIYRYYRYDSATNADHYFDAVAPSGSTRIINGKSYSAEGQEFNVYIYQVAGTIPLYLHYSSTRNDHVFSKYASLANYTNKGLLGYVFAEQQPGTVPLIEYFQLNQQNHFYVSRVSEVEYVRVYVKDAVVVEEVGYVYPGDRVDPSKKAHSLTFKLTYFGWHLNTGILISYRENGVNKSVSYSEKSWNGIKDLTYTLPSTAVITDVNFWCGADNINESYYFSNINTPNFSESLGPIKVSINRLNGNNTIYEVRSAFK